MRPALLLLLVSSLIVGGCSKDSGPDPSDSGSDASAAPDADLADLADAPDGSNPDTPDAVIAPDAAVDVGVDAFMDAPGLAASEASVRVRQGGSAEINLTLTRPVGFVAGVALAAESLPAGVSAEPATVAVGATEAKITLNASPAAAHGGPTAVRITARALDDGAVLAETVVDLRVAGAPGARDESLSFDGVVTYRFGTVSADSVLDMVVDPQGGIVAVGQAGDTPTGGFVFRLLDDGSLDPAFGVDGLIDEFGPFGALVQAVRVRQDELVVLGNKATDADGNSADFMQKLDLTGQRIGTFGTNGEIILPDAFNLLALRPNGYLVGRRDRALGLSETGSVDPTFSADTLPLFPTRKAVVDAQGRVVLGEGSVSGSTYRIARLNADGTVDPSFGAAGVTTFPVPPAHSQGYVRDIAIAADGSIYLATEATYGTDAEQTVRLLGLAPDGSAKPGFGTSGQVTVASPARSRPATSLVIQADGKILIAYSISPSSSGDSKIARYHPDGGLDMSFGVNGIVDLAETYDFPILAYDRASGRLVIAAQISANTAIMRIWL